MSFNLGKRHRRAMSLTSAATIVNRLHKRTPSAPIILSKLWAINSKYHKEIAGKSSEQLEMEIATMLVCNSKYKEKIYHRKMFYNAEKARVESMSRIYQRMNLKTKDPVMDLELERMRSVEFMDPFVLELPELGLQRNHSLTSVKSEPVFSQNGPSRFRSQSCFANQVKADVEVMKRWIDVRDTKTDLTDELHNLQQDIQLLKSGETRI